MKQVRAIGDREGEGFGKALPTLDVQEGGRKQAKSENDCAKHCHAFLPIFPLHTGSNSGNFCARFLEDEALGQFVVQVATALVCSTPRRKVSMPFS